MISYKNLDKDGMKDEEGVVQTVSFSRHLQEQKY